MMLSSAGNQKLGLGFGKLGRKGRAKARSVILLFLRVVNPDGGRMSARVHLLCQRLQPRVVVRMSLAGVVLRSVP